MNFKIFCLLFLAALISHNLFAFEDSQCMRNNFSTKIEKGLDPFGLLKEELVIEKKKCDIFIELNKAKYIKNKWHIDICREPIHIKFGNSLQNVAKKSLIECSQGKDEYCEVLKEVKIVLEDNGLIYGEGIREDLNSQHGKVYCAYLLINQYLKNNIVFSYEKPIEVTLSGTTFLSSLKENSSKTRLIVPKKEVVPSESEETTLYDF